MSQLLDLLDLTDEAIREFDDKVSELKSLEETSIVIEDELQSVAKKLETFEGSQLLLQNLAQFTRDAYASELEKVVTSCLHAVFGEHKRFEIEIKPSRNTVAAYFYVVDTSGDEPSRTPPEDSNSGGIVDTVCIGLRYGLIQMVKPMPMGPIVLDEPSRNFSEDLIDAISSLIKELSVMFNKQTIVVTHHIRMMDIADNCIRFYRKNGYTEIAS